MLMRSLDIVRAHIASLMSSNDDNARTQRNALLAFSVRVISAGLLYLTQVILARWMGTFEYGIYVFIWTWVLMLGGLASLGLNIAAIRLLPEYRETDRLTLLRGYTRGTRLLVFFVGTLLALAGALGLYFFEDYLANYYVLPLYLALICIPMYAVCDLQDGFGRGKAWMGLALFPPYILRPLLILAGMVVALLIGAPMTATTAAISAIVATWAATILQTFWINQKLVQEIGSGSRSYDFPSWFTVATPLLIINACELLLQYTDVLIISRYMRPEDVAIYFAAAKTMSLIMFVHYAVGSAAANRFSALRARGDEAELKTVVADSVKWTFWPSLGAAVLLLLMGKFLLSLFGPNFTDGYPVMTILVAGFLLRSAMGPAEFLLQMLGEQKRCAAILVTTAILNIILNLILVPAYGMVGGATATSIALMTSALLHYIVARRQLGIDVAVWNTWWPAAKSKKSESPL